MNAEYINPFIQGAQLVLRKFFNESPALGKVFLKKPPFAAPPIAVAVSIMGAFKGTVVYVMQPETGCHIAAKMMGMPVTVLDYMSQSAVAELANMISGNVATFFSEKGILVDITPPEFMENAYPNFSSNVVCISLTLQNGMVFEVDVWLA